MSLTECYTVKEYNVTTKQKLNFTGLKDVYKCVDKINKEVLLIVESIKEQETFYSYLAEENLYVMIYNKLRRKSVQMIIY